MNRDQVETMLGEVQRAFPAAGAPGQYNALVIMLARDNTDEGAVRMELGKHLARLGTWPSPKQLSDDLKGKALDVYLARHNDGVSQTIERFGHEYLAMGAVPADVPCRSCSWRQDGDRPSWWEWMDGHADDDMLRHAHYWDTESLGERLTNGATMLDGIPVANLYHAERWCTQHTPGGGAILNGYTYEPLKALMRPCDWREKVAAWEDAAGAAFKQVFQPVWPRREPPKSTQEAATFAEVVRTSESFADLAGDDADLAAFL